MVKLSGLVIEQVEQGRPNDGANSGDDSFDSEDAIIQENRA